MGTLTGGFLNGLQQVESMVEPSRVPEELIDKLHADGLIKEKPGKGVRRQRPIFLLDWVRTSLVFASFTDCLVNARTSLYERVYYHKVGEVFEAPSVPTYGVICASLMPFYRRMRHLIHPFTPIAVRDFPVTFYKGRRLQVYLRALANLMSGGLRKCHSFLKSFLKHEKLATGIKRLVPRLIQPRSPEFNIKVGCYLRHLEHHIYRLIATIFGGHSTVMKGYNCFQVATFMREAWDTFHDPVAASLDASRYDQHIKKTLLMWEHSIYQAFYPGDAELQRLLSWQLVNRGWLRTPDGELKYQVEGGRCSGDMNTALGNCTIMCAAVYSVTRLAGQPVIPRVRLFNNGDDCCLIGERSDIEAIVAHIPEFFSVQLGLPMKVEPLVSVFEQISFCQTQPVYDGLRWRMVRDPRVSLSKDATFLNKTYATTGLSAQLHAIADCGLALCGGIPVMQSYYQSLARGHEHAAGPVDPRFFETGMFQMSHNLSPYSQEVGTDARVSFWRAFGITPDAQVEHERYYDRLLGLGVGGVHPHSGIFHEL